MPSEILLEQLAKSIRTDLQMALERIDTATADPVSRARLAHAACSFMFGAACGAQHNVTPKAGIIAIAESIANDLVEAMGDARLPGLSDANAG